METEINLNKDIFDKVKEYFKYADNCKSMYGMEFRIKDYNFDTLHIFMDGVFVKNNYNKGDAKIYDIRTKKYAEILIYKEVKLTRLEIETILGYKIKIVK